MRLTRPRCLPAQARQLLKIARLAGEMPPVSETQTMYNIVHQFRPLCVACNALLPSPIHPESVAVIDCVATIECRRCHETYARFLPGWIPTEDEELSTYYGDNVAVLMTEFGHSFWPAVALARDYYQKFTDDAYCRSIGIPVQDHDFFWHEARGMAARIHYYLALGGNPDPGRFIDWRAGRNRLRRKPS